MRRAACRTLSARVTAGMVFGTSIMMTAVTGCTSSGAPPAGPDSSTPVGGKPNILMVLVDDLGYSDLGAYGGEASTPNIDELARSGTQFTNFHAYPVCGPTRAALLTGQDPHRVGLGSMEGRTPPGVPVTTPGYKGSLEGEFTGVAEILSDADYSTYQVGKWHLGSEPGQTPHDLGFERNFTMYEGGASHYADALPITPSDGGIDGRVHYERDGQRVGDLPRDFYSTEAYTDEMIELIDQGSIADRPFFGYLAYTAVHDPIQIPEEAIADLDLDRYDGVSDHFARRDQRVETMAQKGLIDPEVAIRWADKTPAWDSLTQTQQQDLTRRLVVYTAMIEEVDQQVGRIVDHLKKTGEYDNTLILLASDNGAASAGRSVYMAGVDDPDWQDETYPAVGDINMHGHPGSYTTLGFPNAQVSSGPFFQAKSTVFEGGTRVPMIVKAPGATFTGAARIDGTFGHVVDLYPTFTDYAGVEPYRTDRLAGNSMKPLLDGTSTAIGDDRFGMEHFGQRAYRDGDWKLLFAPREYGGSGEYSLYSLKSDPGETTDLAATHPDRVLELARSWDLYAMDNGVVPVDFDTVNAASVRSVPARLAVDWAE